MHMLYQASKELFILHHLESSFAVGSGWFGMNILSFGSLHPNNWMIFSTLLWACSWFNIKLTMPCLSLLSACTIFLKLAFFSCYKQ